MPMQIFEVRQGVAVAVSQDRKTAVSKVGFRITTTNRVGLVNIDFNARFFALAIVWDFCN